MTRARSIALALAVQVAFVAGPTSAAPPRAATFGPAEAPTPGDEAGPSPGDLASDDPVLATPTDDDRIVDDESAEDPADDPADDAHTAEPAPEPTRPKRYVWGGTEIEAGTADKSATTSGRAVPSRDTDGGVPGGYLGPTDTKEVAPKDGERKLLVAYIVLPLGTLAMVSGAVATWLTHPDHCQERLGRLGNDVNPKQCRGLWILNIVRTTYGSMMIASGAVLLGLGLRERKRYREWTRKHGAFVQPWMARDQGGVMLGGRF